jgi:hypothetical protein
MKLVVSQMVNLSEGILSIIAFLSDFAPNPTFLSDIAAFEAVVIAIAIPLSLEIVSRISERYESEVISRRFLDHWSIKWLPILLIGNIIIAVVLRFFSSGDPKTSLWKVVAWITLFAFLIMAGILLFGFIPTLKRYMTGIDFILEDLFDEAETLLQK